MILILGYPFWTGEVGTRAFILDMEFDTLFEGAVNASQEEANTTLSHGPEHSALEHSITKLVDSFISRSGSEETQTYPQIRSRLRTRLQQTRYQQAEVSIYPRHLLIDTQQ